MVRIDHIVAFGDEIPCNVHCKLSFNTSDVFFMLFRASEYDYLAIVSPEYNW
ncbi:hypothetical protein D3C80_2238830 [compost metagenome]